MNKITHALSDIAHEISNNISYVTTHLQTLCIIEEPLNPRLTALRRDTSWMNDWYDKSIFCDRNTFRNACLLTIRNMLFRITSTPNSLQYHYDKDTQKGIFDAFWMIDQCSKILTESEARVLSDFSIPFLDKVTDISEWVLEEYGDVPLTPWSLYYVDTDRTSILQRLTYLMRRGLTNERLMAFLMARSELLDHFTGNCPPGTHWKKMIEEQGSHDLYELATLNDIDKLKTVSQRIFQRLPKKDTA